MRQRLPACALAYKTYPLGCISIAHNAQPRNAKELAARHRQAMIVGSKEVDNYLVEGTLTEQFIVDNVDAILTCMRRCNVSLRWVLLHR